MCSSRLRKFWMSHSEHCDSPLASTLVWAFSAVADKEGTKCGVKDGGESLTWNFPLPPSQEPGKHRIVTVARLQEPPFPEQGRELGRYVQRPPPCCSSSRQTRGLRHARGRPQRLPHQ